MASPAEMCGSQLIVGLEEMWTELYAPKTIVCNICGNEGREIDFRPI
jgi:hypothetical protein